MEIKTAEILTSFVSKYYSAFYFVYETKIYD